MVIYHMVESGKTNLLKKQIQVIISYNFHSFPSQVSKIPFNHPHFWLLASKKNSGRQPRDQPNHPNFGVFGTKMPMA